MPTASEEFGSPRDVIRHWLSRTNGGDMSFVAEKRHEHGMDEDKHRRYQHTADHHFGTEKPPQQDSGFRLGQHRKTEAKAMPTDAGYRGRARSVDKPGESLASRLGLQAPFRLLGVEGHPQDLQRHGRHRMKKQRISVSSGTTYLQPATAAVNTDPESDNRNRSRQHRSRGGVYNVEDNDLTISTIPSSSSSVTECVPKKPAKTYERRPRHKTRDDRYGKKQVEKLEKARAKKAEKKDGKRKRKASSGAALAHEFRAKNVTQDRLTFMPGRKVGLFKKGRASSPVRRIGLPDLAFSEMTFLRTRRDRDRETEVITNRNKRRRKDKTADAEEEISRFFTSARVPTAEGDAEICRTRSHGQGAVTDSRRRRSENKRCASSVNSSALPESIAAADLPGRPFLGFGNRGSRPLSPTCVHENTSDTFAAKSPVRNLSVSTVQARSHFTWSRSPAASRGSETNKVLDCGEGHPLGKEDGVKFGEPVLDVGQLNPSGSTLYRCQCQADNVHIQNSPKGNELRTDAVMSNADSGESPKHPEQDQSNRQDIKEAKPDDQNDEGRPTANVFSNQQAAKLSAADASNSDCAVLKDPLLPVETRIGTQEEGLEVFDLGIDRLLCDYRTKAAEVAHGEGQHSQTVSPAEQGMSSPVPNRQHDSHSMKIVELQEQMETCDRYLHPWDTSNAAAPGEASEAGMTPHCTVSSEPRPNPRQNKYHGIYGRNMSIGTTEGYSAVSQGLRNVDEYAWQGVRKLSNTQTPDRGRPVTERSDALMHDSNTGIVCGSWPVAYEYNLAGPSIERLSYQNLYAAQDSDRDYDPESFYDGGKHGQRVDNYSNELENEAEGWRPPCDDVTMVQDLRLFGECGLSGSREQIDEVDGLSVASSSAKVSNVGQVISRGYPHHRFIGLGSSAARSPSSFPRHGHSGSLFSSGIADQRYTNGPRMPGFWQPHKLY